MRAAGFEPHRYYDGPKNEGRRRHFKQASEACSAAFLAIGAKNGDRMPSGTSAQLRHKEDHAIFFKYERLKAIENPDVAAEAAPVLALRRQDKEVSKKHKRACLLSALEANNLHARSIHDLTQQNGAYLTLITRGLRSSQQLLQLNDRNQFMMDDQDRELDEPQLMKAMMPVQEQIGSQGS